MMKNRIQEEITNIIDEKMCQYMEEYKAKSGDISPIQCFELENSIEKIAEILNDVINQNL